MASGVRTCWRTQDQTKLHQQYPKNRRPCHKGLFKSKILIINYLRIIHFEKVLLNLIIKNRKLKASGFCVKF